MDSFNARIALAPLALALALALASPLAGAAPSSGFDMAESLPRFEHALIHFASGSSDLTPGSQRALAELVSRALASGRPIASLRLEGHTDQAGEDFYNNYLGSDRALSAGARIEETLFVGLPVAAFSFGPREPAASCMESGAAAKSSACMAASRRVDAYIVYR